MGLAIRFGRTAWGRWGSWETAGGWTWRWLGHGNTWPLFATRQRYATTRSWRGCCATSATPAPSNTPTLPLSPPSASTPSLCFLPPSINSLLYMYIHMFVLPSNNMYIYTHINHEEKHKQTAYSFIFISCFVYPFFSLWLLFACVLLTQLLVYLMSHQIRYHILTPRLISWIYHLNVSEKNNRAYLRV